MPHKAINVIAKPEDSGTVPQPHEEGSGSWKGGKEERRLQQNGLHQGMTAYCRAHYTIAGSIIQL